MNKFWLLLKSDIYQSRYKYLLIATVVAGTYLFEIILYSVLNPHKNYIPVLPYVLSQIFLVLMPINIAKVLVNTIPIRETLPASQVKKYLSIFTQCYILMPLFVLVISELFEHTVINVSSLNYMPNSLTGNNFIPFFVVPIYLGISMTFLIMNLSDYKKLAIFSTVFCFLPMIIGHYAVTMNSMQLEQFTNTLNIVSLIIFITINYISWRVFKNKQL